MTKVNQRSICLPVCLSTFLPIYLSTFLPFYLSTFVPFYLSTYLPFYLSTFLPIYISTYLPFYLSTFLPIYLSTFLPFHPSIWINLSIFLWLSSNAIPEQSYMNDFPAQKKHLNIFEQNLNYVSCDCYTGWHHPPWVHQLPPSPKIWQGHVVDSVDAGCEDLCQCPTLRVAGDWQTSSTFRQDFWFHLIAPCITQHELDKIFKETFMHIS